MATDVYNRRLATGGESFSADDALLTFAGAQGSSLLGSAGTPLVLQNFQVNYQQPVNMLFDLSSPVIHFVRGRAVGSGALGQIFGPAQLQIAFLKTYGDVCNAWSW
jgi:enoyl-CoA hydratase/carnithine racemase